MHYDMLMQNYMVHYTHRSRLMLHLGEQMNFHLNHFDTCLKYLHTGLRCGHSLRVLVPYGFYML